MPAAWTRLALLAVLAVGPARLTAADPPPPVQLPLTSFEVVTLIAQGETEDGVIRAIHQTNSTFRLTPADRQMLKSLGVSDRVLAVMAGQGPKPVEQAPPPRPAPATQRAVTVLPDGRVIERIGIDFGGPAGPPPAPPVVRTAVAPPRPLPTLQQAAALAVVPPTAAPCAGTWYRDIGPMQVVLKFSPDHLTATVAMTARLDEGVVTQGMAISADFVVARDGHTLHGLITGADMVCEGELPADADPIGLAGEFKQLQAMVDQPFALTVRVRDGELMVSRVRIPGPADEEVREPFELLAGRYKSAGGKPVPKPKPMSPQTSAVPTPLPTPHYLPHPPPYFDGPPPLPAGPVAAPPVPYGPYPVPPQAAPVLQAGGAPVPPPPPPPPAPKPAAGRKPLGTWVREVEPLRLALTFADDRMTTAVEFPDPDGDPVSVTIEADYSVTPDGVLYGVVTAIDSDNLALAAMNQSLVGESFSARFRLDDAGLTLRDVRFLGLGAGARDASGSEAMTLFAAGRYQKGEPGAPKARGKKKASRGGAGLPPLVLRNEYASDPVVRVEQLVGQADRATHEPPLLAPAPVAASPGAARPVGMWVRDLDGMQVVLKLTDKRLFATVHTATLDDAGKEVRATFRADADYAVGPDGTLFGVITGTDATPARSLAELNGMPFCFRFRLDDGVLSVRDVKCGELTDVDASGMSGRFRACDKEPAPPKAAKQPACRSCEGGALGAAIGTGVGAAAGATIGGITLPDPSYLRHAPQYFPPDPPFPLQRELESVIEVAPPPRPVREATSR